MRRDALAVGIGIAIAILAQIILAPNIAIFSAKPNFLLAIALIIAITRPEKNSSLVLAFALGLFFDLIGHSPVGAMAFLFVLASFVVSRVYALLSSDSLIMFIIVFLSSVLVVEVLYALFLTIFGVSAGLFEMIVLRALPCALYDLVVGLLIYLFASRFFVEAPVTTRSMHGSTSTPASVSLGTMKSPKRSRVSKKKMPKF